MCRQCTYPLMVVAVVMEKSKLWTAGLWHSLTVIRAALLSMELFMLTESGLFRMMNANEGQFTPTYPADMLIRVGLVLLTLRISRCVLQRTDRARVSCSVGTDWELLCILLDGFLNSLLVLVDVVLGFQNWSRNGCSEIRDTTYYSKTTLHTM